MYEVEGTSATKNQRLKSLRLIELSDHITRLNRRENTQLELRLDQLKREETVIQRNYDREIYLRRLQLEQIYNTLNESYNDIIKNNRIQTPMSFYALKMQRNQSAPPNMKGREFENKSKLRPSTTPVPRTKRAMSVFKEITLKPTCQTLGNMLVLLDNQPTYTNHVWPMRSKTMFNLK